MQEWKQILAVVSVMMLIAWSFLHLAVFGPMLQDSEFDQALSWAEQSGIDQVTMIQEYPFAMITRADAASWYVKAAQDAGVVPMRSVDQCQFDDIAGHPEEQMMILSCQYGFFQGVDQRYRPDNYLTKASSIVALVRGFYPGVSFVPTEPYREPYIEFAYQEDITKRQSSPYMNYLITQYELLLQLWRVVNRRSG